MVEVVIYTTQVCPYCNSAKALFRKKGVAYSEVDVSNDDAKRTWLVQTTGQRTVPQIFIDGKSYGGFSDVSALDQRGGLDPLLRA